MWIDANEMKAGYIEHTPLPYKRQRKVDINEGEPGRKKRTSFAPQKGIPRPSYKSKHIKKVMPLVERDRAFMTVNEACAKHGILRDAYYLNRSKE